MAYPRFQKARDFKFARRTSGNLTLNSTTWANVDTGLDLTLNQVQVNDVIEYVFVTSLGNEAVFAWFDVATIVSNNPVNQFANRSAPDNTHQGWSGWVANSGVYSYFGAPAWYTIQAADISNGSVTFRLRYRTSAAANKTLYATTNYATDVFVRNLGPVDLN